MAEKEDSMFHLANEENIHLKDKVVDLESCLNSLKNLVDKLTNEIAVKNSDIGSMAEKLTVMREESFLKVVQSN
jgi:predicted  nucleic acid-binding Zn-ribbon protein